MKTVILDVRPLSKTLSDFSKAWKSRKASSARISFESPEVLFKVLTGKRWELLQVLTGAGPVTIREAARRIKARPTTPGFMICSHGEMWDTEADL